MGDGASRRTMLALSAASVLSACSLMSYMFAFDADNEAMEHVLEAVRSFARTHGYRDTKPSVSRAFSEDQLLSLEFERPRSQLRFFQARTGDYIAELRYTEPTWFGRSDNLEAWLAELKETLRQIDGVRIIETPA
jgi:hypothetical protein